MYVYICIQCIYVYIYLFMYICLYLSIYVGIYLPICICMYLYIHMYGADTRGRKPTGPGGIWFRVQGIRSGV